MRGRGRRRGRWLVLAQGRGRRGVLVRGRGLYGAWSVGAWPAGRPRAGAWPAGLSGRSGALCGRGAGVVAVPVARVSRLGGGCCR